MTVDSGYDPAANALVPGAEGDWPTVAGKAGPADLSKPAGPLAAMAYLHDFDGAWAAVRRLDDGIAATLSWDARSFPCAWLWYELGGTAEAPWFGSGKMIGIEPCTTRSGAGLADAKARGAALLHLEPREELSAELRLHVFKPSGRVNGVDREGRAFAAQP